MRVNEVGDQPVKFQIFRQKSEYLLRSIPVGCPQQEQTLTKNMGHHEQDLKEKLTSQAPKEAESRATEGLCMKCMPQSYFYAFSLFKRQILGEREDIVLA